MDTNDKSHRAPPPATSPGCVEFETGMMLSRLEERASISCALTVIHITFMRGMWREDSMLRTLLLYVIDLNVEAGMRGGLTDAEDAILMGMREELAQGGAA
jgi:hypothetical protein